MRLVPGTRLGAYEIIALLGEIGERLNFTEESR
jgi:hypothetical protein